MEPSEFRTGQRGIGGIEIRDSGCDCIIRFVIQQGPSLLASTMPSGYSSTSHKYSGTGSTVPIPERYQREGNKIVAAPQSTRVLVHHPLPRNPASCHSSPVLVTLIPRLSPDCLQNRRMTRIYPSHQSQHSGSQALFPTVPAPTKLLRALSSCLPYRVLPIVSLISIPHTNVWGDCKGL